MKIIFRIISAIITIAIIPLWIVICILIMVYGLLHNITYHNFSQIEISPELIDKIGSTPPNYLFLIAKLSTLMGQLIAGFIDNIKQLGNIKL